MNWLRVTISTTFMVAVFCTNLLEKDEEIKIMMDSSRLGSYYICLPEYEEISSKATRKQGVVWYTIGRTYGKMAWVSLSKTTTHQCKRETSVTLLAMKYIYTLTLDNHGLVRLEGSWNNFPRLENLFLNNNLLETFELRTFRTLVNLKKIVLHGNRVKSLDLFWVQYDLKTIFLQVSSKHLTSINCTCKPTDWNFQQCENEFLAPNKSFPVNKVKTTKPVTLLLSNSNTSLLSPICFEILKHPKTVNASKLKKPVNCDCTAMEHSKLVMQKCPCLIPNHSENVFSDEAFNDMWVLIAFLGTLAMIYFMYKKKFNENQKNIKIRVYLVSAESDYAIVEKIAEKLEGVKIETTCEQRDFAEYAGKIDLSPAFDALKKSKKTIFLVSEEFCKDEMCMYKLHVAKSEEVKNRDPIVLIALIRDHNLPCEFEGNVCLEYLPNSVKFWNKLLTHIRN